MPGPIETLHQEWPVVKGAFWSFLILAVILVAVTWGFFTLIHGAENAGKDATIESLKQEVESYKDKLSGATPEEAKAKIADLQAKVTDLEARLDVRLTRVEPRRLTDDQRHIISTSIAGRESSGDDHGTFLETEMGCTDCSQYAAGFSASLNDAHWKIVSGGFFGGSSTSPKGVTIFTLDPANPSPEAKALADAFTAAKIPFDLKQMTRPTPQGYPVTSIEISPRVN